jgi:hypothetical protein
MASTPILCAGDSLQVGQIEYPLSGALSLFPGRCTLNGPIFCGANFTGGVPTANAMFGPPLWAPGLPSLEIVGTANVLGSFNVSAVSVFTGSSTLFGISTFNGIGIKNAVDLKNSLNIGNGGNVFNGTVTANGGANIQGFLGVNGVVNIKGAVDVDGFVKINGGLAVTGPKQFDIPHPSKSGYRLAHACLEGPEAGVYYRGKLKDNNYIELPSYWKDLVDIETITVHFTPNLFYQELYVKSIQWGCRINVANNLGGPINCDYIVYAERKDVDKLVVEYEEGSN